MHDVVLKLDAVRSRLIDSREKPHGDLRVTTTLRRSAPIGWRRGSSEFVELYPEVKLQLLLSDDELDLGMREADVALRLREPMQPDLIRRRLFTVHFHAYASTDYLKKSGQPRTIADLDQHRLVAFGAPTATHFLYDLNSLLTVGRDPKIAAHAPYRDQQCRRHHPRRRARRRHRGAARLLRRSRIPASCGCCRRRTCRKWIAFWSMPRK